MKRFFWLFLLASPAWAFKLTPVETGLEFPVGAVAEPGTGTLHFVEQVGRIRYRKGKKLETFLDHRKTVSFGGECGLLSMAFHPQYAKNGRYFVYYTARTPDLMVYLSEFQKGQAKEKVLLKFRKPYPNHNGGQVMFDSQGYLYFGTGDGGLSGDPLRAGQDTKSILGKILRIDVDKGNPYGVPADNPFATSGGLKEIYAWGLRNPWRFSFDPKTGAMFAADVGQDSWEEIDRIEKGKNYGWSVREGNHCYRPDKGCADKDLVPALYEYGREEGESVTGGYVYRGKGLPSLEGAYVFGDYVTGMIWALRLDDKQQKVLKRETLMTSGVQISSFGLDDKNEILVMDHPGGRVLRLDP